MARSGEPVRSSNPFDQAGRYLAKLEPALFLAWLLRLTPAQLRFRRWLNARRVRFPGEPDRTCDTVALLEDLGQGGLPWAVPIEFETRPRASMFGRLLGYLGALWLEMRPSRERGDRFQVGAVVVNLTGTGESSRQMSWPKAELLTHLGVVERNLSGYDAATVLADVAAGRAPAVVLPLIPLMQGGDESGNIATWLRLMSLQPQARRAEYAGLTLVFAEAARRQGVWKKALAGWNMRQSKQVLEWQAEGRVESLLEVLESRFGELPEDLTSALRALTSVPRLKALAPLVGRSPSLDEFRRDAKL